MCIYKIINSINTKIYIGLTTVSLQQRWVGHQTQARIGNQKPLYRAMRKYGIENFSIEIVCETDSYEELGKLERYYIKEYNSRVPNGYNISSGGEHNQLDANPRAKLKENDIYDIREIYNSLTMSCSQCYQIYRNLISYSAFEKIWEGYTWTSVHMDVYTDQNIKFHKEKWKINRGQKNGNGISDQNILKARLYYETHSFPQTYEKYGDQYSSKDSFRQALNYGYSHMPIYKKVLQKWFLNSIEIDINTWLASNPVSTISESGE